MQKLLKRYTKEQIEFIGEYWDTIRFTRKTNKISDGIKKRELEYWDRFPPIIVIEAIRIHIENYPNIRENYTRGIIRNIKSGSINSTINKTKKNGKPSFDNFTKREYDPDKLKKMLLERSKMEVLL